MDKQYVTNENTMLPLQLTKTVSDIPDVSTFINTKLGNVFFVKRFEIRHVTYMSTRT